jgi:hypothetical protein
MFNMMYATGNNGFIFLWALHVLSVIAFFVGVFFLLLWAFKHLSEKQLKQWGWALIIGGSLVCLFTIASMGHPWPGFGSAGMMGSRTMMPMMGQWQGTQTSEESAAQEKEEADGKALYEKLQAKQMSCADLSDDQFELIGEYLMGQRAGANHELMNGMMKQMMGDEGEVQMHIYFARSQTGCAK